MLNDTQCRTAKPRAKPYKMTDGNGLYLEVKPNGKKAWRYRFELREGDQVKESTYAVGDYGSAPSGETPEAAQLRKAGRVFTLAEAREERAKARALVVQGINPAHHRQASRLRQASESAVTFEVVAREWVASKDWESQTKGRRLDMFERVVFPKIGRLPIRSVTAAHVLDVLKGAAENNGLTVAAEAKRSMSGVFDLATSTLRADFDPVYPVRKAIPANKTQHKKALTKDEIGQLLADMSGHGGKVETITAFRLMWWTLTRPSETMEAKWSEFDLDAAVWRIPAERMKMRDEHVVPLPQQAVEALKVLKQLTGRHIHLFPNRDDRTRPMAVASFRQALKTVGWAGRYSPHATRTTGSTRLNEMGYSGDWVERQLGHLEPNAVRRTYNHAQHLADRVHMMQAWADMLEQLEAAATRQKPEKCAAK